MWTHTRRATDVARAGLALMVLALLLPQDARAQRHAGHVHEEEDDFEEEYYEHEHHRRSSWELGGGFAVAVPQGEFSRFVDEGYGLALHTTVGLDPTNVVALRFDAGFVTYGNERFSVPLLPSTGRILIDLNTRNNIGFLGLGPQLQVPDGPIRPYVNGFVGLGYFFTESSVRGSSNFEFDSFARTLNFDDVSLAYGAGGGLGVRLGNGRTPVFLNFEAQYRKHGKTEYLVEGSIIDDGFGGVFIDPLFTDADFLLVQVGLSVGL